MLLCENWGLSHEMEGSVAMLQIATLPSETAILNFYLQLLQRLSFRKMTRYVAEWAPDSCVFPQKQGGKGRATLCGRANFLVIQGWCWFQVLSAADST